MNVMATRKISSPVGNQNPNYSAHSQSFYLDWAIAVHTYEVLTKSFRTPFGIAKGMMVWSLLLVCTFVSGLPPASIIYVALVCFYVPSSETTLGIIYNF
jgi:hypothetical protein